MFSMNQAVRNVSSQKRVVAFCPQTTYQNALSRLRLHPFKHPWLYPPNFNILTEYVASECAVNSTTSTPSIGRGYSAKRGNVICQVPGWRGSPFGNNAEISTPVVFPLFLSSVLCPPSLRTAEMQRDLDMGYIEAVSRSSPSSFPRR